MADTITPHHKPWKIKRRIALLISIALFQAPLYAKAGAISSIERQNQIVERQQNQRLREEQQRAIQSIPIYKDAEIPVPRVTLPDSGAACRDITHIDLSGEVTLVSDSMRQKINHNYTGRCLSINDIEAVLTLLTQSFFSRGLITTRAYLPQQNLHTGRLLIEIVPGKIEKYDLHTTPANAPDATPSGDKSHGGVSGQPKNKQNSAIWLGGAFAGQTGGLLNLRDLEQGIDQLDRLSSNNVKLDLRPGTRPGYTVVSLENSASFPLHLYTSYDNQNAASTGKNNLSATVTADSLFGLNDLFSITRRQSAFPFDGGHRSDSTGVFFQLSYGYNTFSVNYGQNNYINEIPLPSGDALSSSGRNDSWNISASRVLYRDQLSRLSLQGQFSTQRTDNWLGGEYLQISSRRLITADIALSGFRLLGGGVASGNLDYMHGIRDVRHNTRQQRLQFQIAVTCEKLSGAGSQSFLNDFTLL